MVLGIVKNHGRDFNFFQKINVTWSTFGGGQSDNASPECQITFRPSTLILLNNDTGSNVLEYSFNGTTVHGELDAAKLSKMMTFPGRGNSLIWFRIKSGSSACVVDVTAY